MADRFRVLLVSAHPVQYASPMYRRMARHPQLQIKVAYCSLQGAEAGIDPEFGVEVKWDVPLLEGYPWVEVPNRSPRPGLGRFMGLLNPGLWNLVARGGFDAVVVYTGYAYASFWIVLAAAKLHGLPLLFGTDAAALAPRDGSRWKPRLKSWLWPRIFGLATVVIVPSTRGAQMMRSLDIPASRLVMTPYVVDNDWWTAQVARVDRAAVRQAWEVPPEAPVVLFCAKLQAWKRPMDLLNAFAAAEVPGSHLVFAGEGPEHTALERRACELGVMGRTRFLGFTNQSALPSVYSASDLMVLPSDYEPFGVVVNEAMLCGCPVIASDQVGAVRDLIYEGQTGHTYPCGNVEALAARLQDILLDRDKLGRMSLAACKRMETWSPKENIDALVRAIGQAIDLTSNRVAA